MKIAISIVLAFLLSGISQVIGDLGSPTSCRPAWARRPTLGWAIIAAATWFIHPFLGPGNKARTFVFGLLAVVLQMSILTGFVWLCISVATHVFDSTVLQVMTTGVLIIIGALFVLPLVSFIMVPLMLIVAWPLNLLFPPPKGNDV